MNVATIPFEGTFTADPAHSSFQAAVSHMKVGRFRTSFGDVDARLVADDSGVELEGAARVESISIQNPPEFRDHVVRSEDFFDADRHPEIAFRSTEIDLADDGTLRLAGELTIKGRTGSIEATGTWREPVEDPYGSVRTAMELSTTVDRRDYGIDWQAPLPKGGDVLGWEVGLSVHLELVRGR